MGSALNLSDTYLDQIIASITDAIPTKSVYVFGSYARGEETADSDLDIYVVTSDETTGRFDLMSRVGTALVWMDTPKDILVGSVARFAEKQNNLADIEYVVAREGVKVYDRAA